MPHASGIQYHSSGDNLVIVSFSVPAEDVTMSADEALIRTDAQGVIAVPKTLITDSPEPGFVVFQARVPSDVAASVGRICAEVFRLAYTNQAD
jgi:hypothetical protein